MFTFPVKAIDHNYIGICIPLMTGVEYWYFQEVTFIFEMYLVL